MLPYVSQAAESEIEAFVLQLADVFFQFRRLGQEVGSISSKGGGTWGLLRLLATDGPLTVPEIASARGVSRQHIQMVVNELIEQDLLVLLENPAHKRSRHVAITPPGEQYLQELTRRFREELADLMGDVDTTQIAPLTETLRHLGSKLEQRLDGATG